MKTWLERAEEFGDVPDWSSPNFIYAGTTSDIVSKIVSGVKMGLATGAIIALLNIPLSDRADYERFIDYIRDREGITEQEVMNTIDEEALGPSVMDVPKSQEPVEKEESGGVDHDAIYSLLSGYEGKHNHVYDDGAPGAPKWSQSKRGYPTVGVGHLMTGTQDDRKIFLSLFGSDVDYDKLMRNEQDLTDDQVEKLFKYDSQSRIDWDKFYDDSIFFWVSKRIPEFENFNSQTQAAIMNAKYRGDLGPKTIARINEGDWEGAAKEYLNHREYIDTKQKVMKGIKTNKRGIIPRMEHNAEVLRSNAN